jgi:uncharacterized membrane protein YphA (DoxX/SURF4 family)
MNTAIWIAQILLAAAFLIAGVRKFTQSYEKQAESKVWVKDYTPTQLHLIGAVEVLGAIGIILPALTGILPWLAPVAAIGLVLTMIGAMVTNMRHRLYGGLIANIILAVIAVFVIYGRFVAVPL